ncbi:hypothetical protein FQN55_005813 [Onygenales sp. PD_40]|nr:hypothetical protein FQN55_005813 [Onygenales sp. PD_40]
MHSHRKLVALAAWYSELSTTLISRLDGYVALDLPPLQLLDRARRRSVLEVRLKYRINGYSREPPTPRIHIRSGKWSRINSSSYRHTVVFFTLSTSVTVVFSVMRFPTSLPKRIFNFTIRPAHIHRSLHTKQAEFITLDQRGYPVTQKVNVDLGHPNQAFTLLPKEIGFAFRAGIPSNSRSLTVNPLAKDSDQCPLTFYHDSQYFAHESSPCPRLVIPQALPHQSDANMSPATLHTFGATHSITLDGTFDEYFTNHLRDSLRDLKGSLDQLKDV